MEMNGIDTCKYEKLRTACLGLFRVFPAPTYQYNTISDLQGFMIMKGSLYKK
jgi:hypothetical protein